ncbi:hypothetical protein ABZV78_31755, partial [Micromonospora sp. NPDC004540]|uniref:hypothetical protein n=1 Tax=Micromonospora sp. NPDC004540 TaxID=3154457 RepID=UPI00339E30CB
RRGVDADAQGAQRADQRAERAGPGPHQIRVRREIQVRPPRRRAYRRRMRSAVVTTTPGIPGAPH